MHSEYKFLRIINWALFCMIFLSFAATFSVVKEITDLTVLILSFYSIFGFLLASTATMLKTGVSTILDVAFIIDKTMQHKARLTLITLNGLLLLISVSAGLSALFSQSLIGTPTGITIVFLFATLSFFNMKGLREIDSI